MHDPVAKKVLSVKEADELYADLLLQPRRQQEGRRPAQEVRHTEKSRKTTDEYCAGQGKDDAAEILGVSRDAVVLEKDYLLYYTDLGQPQIDNPSSATIGKAFTILAFGKLSSAEGLQTFGPSNKHIGLESGQVLLASGDLPQRFSGKGGGIAFVGVWTCR